VVIVSQPLFLSETSRRRLRKYVEDGGHLILSGPAGLYDERGIPTPPFLEKEFGIKTLSRTAFPEEIRFVSGLKVKQLIAPSKTWRVELASKNTDTCRAMFSDGSPAVLETVIGKGTAVLTTYAFAQTAKIEDQLRELVLPRLRFPASTERPIHLYFLEKGGDTLIYAVNRATEPVERELQLDRPRMVEDLRAGVSMRTAKLPLHFEAGEGRVFRIRSVPEGDEN
jgi:hypothetical protein